LKQEKKGLLRALSGGKIGEKRENETLEATAATAVIVFFRSESFSAPFFSIARDSCLWMTKKGEV
jgi:hypothetical protein